MSIELENFDVRPVFVSRLLSHSGVSPLTGTETIIAKSRDILIKIEDDFSEELSGTLLNLLNKVAPYVNYRDSILFLLDCYDEDMSLTAIQTLKAAYDREKTLKANDLIEIIKESIETGVPASLIVNLLGEEKEEKEIESNITRSSLRDSLNNSSFNSSTFVPSNKSNSGLNRSAMDDFLNNR